MIFAPYSKTIKNDEYIETLRGVLDDIDKIVQAETTVYTFENQTLVTERLATSLRHVSQQGSRLSRLIKGQILESAFKAEKSGPNSTKLYLKFISTLIRDLIDDVESGKPTQKIIKDLDSFYEDFLEMVKKEMKPGKWDDVVECVSNASKSKRISEMVLEAVSLAGLEGNIVPAGSPNGKYSVELVSGYNFPVTTYPLFTEEDNGRWGRGNVRVLVVDGVIERVSEVHKIMNEAYSNKAPHLFVARGYGEEVIGTIASNKGLDICPIRIPWELEQINLVADIAIVSGTDIVSSMKGDMVSSIDYDSLKIVDKVICTKENLNIINSKTQEAVVNHVNDLSKRREDTHVEEMSEFLNKRIKSLNSHTVHIRLGSKTEQEKMKELEAADFSLRIVKSILDKGTVRVSELEINEKMPTNSVLSACFYGIALAKSLISVECVIMEDV